MCVCGEGESFPLFLSFLSNSLGVHRISFLGRQALGRRAKGLQRADCGRETGKRVHRYIHRHHDLSIGPHVINDKTKPKEKEEKKERKKKQRVDPTTSRVM